MTTGLLSLATLADHDLFAYEDLTEATREGFEDNLVSLAQDGTLTAADFDNVRVDAEELIAAGVATATVPAAGQLAFHGQAGGGRLEHRVRDGGVAQAASGLVLGAGFGLALGETFEIRGEALGGRLLARTSESEDRDVAELQLVAGAAVRPWLTAIAGVSARAYRGPLADQRWTAVRLGAEARLPLAIQGMRGVVRGEWSPVVSVSGRAGPELGLGAAAGLEWHGKRVGVDVLYTLERYDFPPASRTQRLEEVASLRLNIRIHQNR